MQALSGWENFYVIVGSSAGALIGLQFVVITLISDLPAMRDAERAGSAFATPTIIHFGSVLLLSAALSAPWDKMTGPAVIWGILGIAGLIYVLVVGRRMRQQTLYRPVFEDRLFHLLLPLAAYASLIGSACAAAWHFAGALFGVAASVLVLLFVGIHNAWDAVTYHVFVVKKRQQEKSGRTE